MERQRTGMGIGIVFWVMIIILAVCVKGVAKKNGAAGRNEPYGAGARRTSQDRAVRPAAGAAFPAERKTGERKGGEAAPIRQRTAAPDNGPEEGSTLDYLADKAEEDRLLHEREEAKRRLKMNQEAARGGYVYAGRLPDSGVAGPGERVVVCGYCGAENVLPGNASGKYNCYFCREELGRRAPQNSYPGRL